MAEPVRDKPTTRRALLTGAAAAAAAVAASAVRPPSVAAIDGGNLVLGGDNTATNSTRLIASGNQVTAMYARATATSGIGVEGWANGTDAARSYLRSMRYSFSICR